METESSKRHAPHEDEADEEEKMEQFYALLRRIKATKDRLRAESSESKKKKVNERKAPWAPSFELEDFAQEIDFKNPVSFWGPPKKSQKKEKDQTLDLNLSL
ncbi:protein NIM1-INTERACTING 1-like [Aristolochia californica]|uniref:protein NIM1-INTERACTING 1-like n=1 Tax=Aristolochia californica TaxID=171875 RepID=UPI0035D9FD6E